jgi:hypothetical protein
VTPAGAGTNQAKAAAMRLELAYESERRSNNVMDPNIYFNAIVFYRLAQRGQKQKAVPEPELRQFDLTYLTGAPGKRDHSQNTSRPGEARHNLSDALPA